MHFGTKSYLKSTRNHTAKHAIFPECGSMLQLSIRSRFIFWMADPKYTLIHHVQVSPAMQCFNQFKHICVTCSKVQALLILKIPQWTLPACPAYTIRSSSENHKSQGLIQNKFVYIISVYLLESIFKSDS